MKETEFQVLVTQLGGLSEVQRLALLEALKAKRPAAEALKLIEARFDAAPCCGHCGSHAQQPWGQASNLKRYRCKDCRRTFNALTGTPLAQLHRRDVWLAYGQALADGVSLRKAAKRCRIDLTTSFRWRHRFLSSAQDKKARSLAGVVEADETFFLKSQEGSRKIAGRAPRKRGGVARKRGISEEQVPVLIVRDRSTATTDRVLPDLKAEAIARTLDPIVARDALLTHFSSAMARRAAHTDRSRTRPASCTSASTRAPGSAGGGLPHPERQRLREPPQAMVAPVPWRRHQVSAELPRLAAHDRPRGRSSDGLLLHRHRRRAQPAINMKREQSQILHSKVRDGHRNHRKCFVE